MRKIIYISGGITGVPDYKERFAAMETKLKEKYPDAVILNPCRHPAGLTWEQYMDWAYTDVLHSNTVVMLDNWMSSRGSSREYYWSVAKNKQIIHESEV